MCQGNGEVTAAHPFCVYFTERQIVFLKEQIVEQIVQYFLIRENLQDQSTHKSKKL